MLDPVTTPLLLLVLGAIGEKLITKACEDYLKDKLKETFESLAKFGRGDDLKLAYEVAMKDAYVVCLEMLLTNIAACGCSKEELKPFSDSLKSFLRDKPVADALMEAIKDPTDSTLPDVSILAERWEALGCRELPADDLWAGTARAFRRQAKKQAFVNEPLREILSARNLDAIRELLERDGGVRPDVNPDKYVVRMRTKYAPVDLANLMPAHVDNPGRLAIHDVFVPQQVKENPPAVELPKDFEKRLREKGVRDVDELPEDERRELEEVRHAKLSNLYASQSARPVLDVIADPGHRLIMLVGEPGSGKSTLLRYLLLGVLEPPCRAETGVPLSWTEPFTANKTFPLLIELRDFHATRHKNDDVDSFLDYAAFLGRTEQYFLDDQWLDRKLQAGPSLVLFDGLDEIFDRADREKVMQEIVGFAHRYSSARIVVTSRPVGYRDTILRQAEFRHFGLQDLDRTRIEDFIRGWFRLTFSQEPELAEQRVERVLTSLKSPSILILAGNPMLLTIMALLAREQELPRERAAFYEAAVNVLCHNWDANRNIKLPETEYITLEDKKELLRRVAMRMQTADRGLAGNAIHQADLEEEVSEWFVGRFKQPQHEAIKSARLMIGQLRERNYILCLRGPKLYGFVHRTFLEYLTAAEYVARFRDEQTGFDELWALFANHGREGEWREVLRLIAGQINEKFVGQIVEKLANQANLQQWNGRASLPELPLAIYCLSEARNSSRLEPVGAKLLTQILEVFTRGIAPKMDFLEEIVAGTMEMGKRWPGSSKINLPIILESDANYHHVYYPKFLANLTSDREKVMLCATGTQYAVRWGGYEALAEKWPEQATRDLLQARAADDPKGSARVAALRVLVEKWPDQATRDLLQARAADDPAGSARGAALQALAGKWPDQATRDLLQARAADDPEGDTRVVALRVLAEKWPDQATRDLLQARAADDPAGSARRAALEALAGKWPDQATRDLLQARAADDPEGFTRGAALRALAGKWPDQATRDLLHARAADDPKGSARVAALEALVEKWPDQATRDLLQARAADDPSGDIRVVALQALAEKWPDQATRDLLQARAADDPAGSARGAALQALAGKWPDQATRDLLQARAADDPEGDTRVVALQALAEKWPDQATRDLLHARAADDPEGFTRGAALQALAGKWPDQATRDLLQARAADDPEGFTRVAALRVLVEKWPDQDTRDLLHARASDDPEGQTRGMACSVLGGMHSELGRILPTQDLDGTGPYLDPRIAIPRDHIARAAKKLGILPGEIESRLASLSEHLGWDVTKGLQPPPSKKAARKGPGTGSRTAKGRRAKPGDGNP